LFINPLDRHLFLMQYSNAMTQSMHKIRTILTSLKQAGKKMLETHPGFNSAESHQQG